MLVKYNVPGVWVIGSDGALGDITILPGVNDISPSAWKKVCDHPHVKLRLDSGDLEVLDDVQAPKGADPEAKTSLSGMPVKKAEKLIKETVDVELLKFWLDDEKRESVMRAVQVQLDVILKPSAKKEDDSKDDDQE